MPEVKIEESKRFMKDSLKAVGIPESEAEAHATLLLHADLTGLFGHGMNRLPIYIKFVQNGVIDPNAKPVVLKESDATAWVDGCNALGATIGNFCMNLAMKKAKEVGVGWVSAKRCTHIGKVGWWAKQAEREGLIGMAFTNATRIVVPTRAKNAALGTNPLAMFAPASDGDAMLIDMATTAASFGKIEVHLQNGEPIPEGWALGPDGKTTTDAKTAYDTSCLLPLGGTEETSGYKGYCLSAMVETLVSVLSGSNSSHNINPYIKDDIVSPPNLGQCYVALNPDFFAPGFGDRMAECLRFWRNLEPVDPSLPVQAPGDKEYMNEKKTRARGTVIYAQSQMVAFNILADKLNVKPVETA